MTSFIWDPFRGFDDVQNRLAQYFDGHAHVASESQWRPAVDIGETEAEYFIKAELPEVNKETIQLKVENGSLILQGERKAEAEEKGKIFHRVERSFGTFVRKFTLPEDADAAKISADFKDGLLAIHLPKSEAAKPKLIDVKIN